ncbi:ABC transporter permease [Canibacter sp. lx-72]|uniref:ABC transporter permease n=1 Tax=Canibacter zhuwentaonis TaxID=2837491 RepID=UPI001BDD8D2C|nr:ABC transporter permease [Canibacter zhuwentaonis]MBT1018706.1 ABC transporter permease [Canibacter zhuwentaonis]MBT1035873.1 ABC transporter permease [Canibacter zhuwentaonis]
MFLMLLKDLRLSPLRSFLTSFSMLIGIIAVIISVLIGTVGKSYIEATNEQVFGRAPTFAIGVQNSNAGDFTALETIIKRLKATGQSVALVTTPKTQFSFAQVDRGDPNQDPVAMQLLLRNKAFFDTVYATPEYREIYNLPLVSGRWLSDTERGMKLEIVVNKAAAAAMQQNKTVYGLTANSLNPVPFTLVGVVNDGQDYPRFYVNPIPVSFYAPSLWEVNGVDFYWLNKSGYTSEQMSTVINDILSDAGGGKVTQIREQTGAGSYEDALFVLQLGFGAIAALLLFVSAVGLINIGLASLEQRTQELLIRRALGATRGSIGGLVLGGSLLLAVLVAAVAIGVSVLVVASVMLFLPPDSPVTPPEYPYAVALIAVSAAVITALLGGLAPAVKAARLQPALALR